MFCNDISVDSHASRWVNHDQFDPSYIHPQLWIGMPNTLLFLFQSRFICVPPCTCLVLLCLHSFVDALPGSKLSRGTCRVSLSYDFRECFFSLSVSMNCSCEVISWPELPQRSVSGCVLTAWKHWHIVNHFHGDAMT